MGINTKFAKIQPGGTLDYAPTEFYNVDGLDIYDPLGGYALTQGYLTVEETSPPEPKEGFSCAPAWVVKGGKIVRVWTETALPEPVEPPSNSYEERLTALETEIEALKEAQGLQTDEILALNTKIEERIGIEPVEPPVDPIEKEADK